MRWSALQKQLYGVLDRNLNLQIHCTRYRSVSIGVGRYWVTLNGETIWDLPADFEEERSKGPYADTVTDATIVIKHYLGASPRSIASLGSVHDKWGLLDILRAGDRRIGRRTLESLCKRDLAPPARKIVEARLNSTSSDDEPNGRLPATRRRTRGRLAQ